MLYRTIEARSIDRAFSPTSSAAKTSNYVVDGKTNSWTIESDPFIDDWDEQDYRELIAHLRDLVKRGGMLFGAFHDDKLKGFVSVDAAPLGPDGAYRDLCDLFVSADMRNQGIGRTLFEAAIRWAQERGADKLYLSSHSAVETQAFYESVGCVDAVYVSPAHIEKEPFDCQLEYDLQQTSMP